MDDQFAQEAMLRLPLAEATLQIWRWIAPGDLLAEVFDEHRGRSYERVICFATVVQLMADALVRHQGNARRSFEQAIADGTLEASVQAAYGKLRRVPVELSVSFMNEATSRLKAIWPEPAAAGEGDWLGSSLDTISDVLVLDGKTIKRVARRLKPLRKVRGGLLGGRSLAALSLRRGLVEAISANPDGHCSELDMAAQLIEVLRRRLGESRVLWVCDRGLCTQKLLGLFSEGHDSYLLRLHRNLSFTADASVAVREGVDERGRRYQESWGWVGTRGEPRRFAVRQITLYRSASGEDRQQRIVLITNLSDADLHPAVDLLNVYLARWSIEQVFQEVTEVFGLSHLIGTTPQATIFQFAFCVLLYNILQVQRAYIAQAQQRQAREISSEKLFADVRDDLIAWSRFVGASATPHLIRAGADAAMVRARLHQLLRKQWKTRWSKAPPRRNRPPKRCNGPQPGQHYGRHASVHRILTRRKPEG